MLNWLPRRCKQYQVAMEMFGPCSEMPEQLMQCLLDVSLKTDENQDELEISVIDVGYKSEFLKKVM